MCQNGHALQYAPGDLKKNVGVVKAAASQSGHAVEYAHEDLKKNLDVVMAVVSQSGHALPVAHADVQGTPTSSWPPCAKTGRP